MSTGGVFVHPAGGRGDGCDCISAALAFDELVAGMVAGMAAIDAYRPFFITAAAWLVLRGPTVWTPEGDGWMRTRDGRVRLMLGWVRVTNREEAP
jgi:hypothetical protein